MPRCRPLSLTLPLPSPIHRLTLLSDQSPASFAPEHKAKARHV
jgi:hypothetical protein